MQGKLVMVCVCRLHLTDISKKKILTFAEDGRFFQSLPKTFRCLLFAPLFVGQIAAGLIRSCRLLSYQLTITLELSLKCLSCAAKKSEFSGTISGDNFLMCWLCDNRSHIKCGGGGHSGRIGDIVGKRSQFYWA